MKERKSKIWIFLLAMILTLGVFGIAHNADAHSSYLSQYNTYFPGTGAGCGLCHVDPNGGGPLTPTGTTFANSGHNYASIKPTDTTPPTVTITTPTSSPTYTASSSSLSIGGMASDNFTGPFGVTQVSWSNAAGAGNSGTATGTTSWSATIPLSSGSNVITVTAKDYSGNVGTAKLTVTYTQPDTTVPTVSITAPTNGQTVSSTVTVSASASDNVGVAGVQFKLDGANLGAEVTTSPYSVSWKTATASNGSHTLTAVARDAAANTTTSASVLVTVSNAVSDTSPPTVSITAPTNGQTVSGTVTVSASASDNVGVVGVQFKLDGANLGAEVTTSPYSVSWNTTTASNGSHTLTAVARDAAGNVSNSLSASVTISLSNPQPPESPQPQPPTVDLTSWSGQWFKITLKYNGYFFGQPISGGSQDSLSNSRKVDAPGMTNDHEKIGAYLKLVSWDSNHGVLQGNLYQLDSKSGQWVSDSLALHLIGGTSTDFLCWSQVSGDFTSGFTARIQGKEKGENLQNATFKTLGGYYYETSSGTLVAGELSISGTLVPESKVPVPK